MFTGDITPSPCFLIIIWGFNKRRYNKIGKMQEKDILCRNIWNIMFLYMKEIHI
ncbi:hypothetical protein PIPA1_00030 [Pelosinus sp. IPA-1]|nr:hypothetical protein PIPA1_00030 [Pelosinus sp. IPA-1]